MATGIFVNDILGGILIDVPIDARPSETHTLTATPARFVLEDGTVVSDHIVVNQAELTVEFELNNQDVPGSSYGLRSATLFQLLRLNLRSRLLFIVITRHNLYEDMALVSLVADHIAPDVGTLRGTAKFIQIPQPNTFTVDVPSDQVAQDGSQLTASSSIDAGTQIIQDAAQSPSLQQNLTDTFGAIT